MKSSPVFFYLVLLVTANFSLAQVQPLPNAHAHNDYEHERPLLDALENGFTSVEADVYLINGELYVYHNQPEFPDSNRTLVKLYLEPLARIISENGGQVFPDHHSFFYLMIDFKTEVESTYQVLRSQLASYADILSKVTNGKREMNKPVLIFISGERPVETIMNEWQNLATLDGRPSDLGKNISAEKMPVISQNYRVFSDWNGDGVIDETSKKRLSEVINQAHAEDKRVRFWAIPDKPNAWRTLLELGVDLINTDKLEQFSRFMADQK